MAESLSKDVIKDTVLPTVLSLKDDTIPNVRFNVAKSLEVLVPILKADTSCGSMISSQITPALQKLSNDNDQDVKWFANKALLSGKSLKQNGWSVYLC